MFKGGIQKKLFLSHIGVALISLLTIMLLVNVVMYYSFGKYIEEKQKAAAGLLLDHLQASYDPLDKWSDGTLMDISHQAMFNQLIVKIYDDKHHLIWAMDPIGKASAKTRTIQQAIMKDGQQIGTLETQSVDGFYQAQDQHFLQMFNLLMWVAMVLVLLGVYKFSGFIASGISRPLIRIKQIAIKMREGDLSRRVIVANHQTEIEEVGSALNHLAEALQKQDKLRKNLTADIAHELRTPLATIQSHIEAFQDGIWEATADKLQVCHDQVTRLVQLINDLEKLAAAENPMIQLRKEKVCLNQIVQEAVQAVSGSFNHKKLSLKVMENENVYMPGDHSRLVQVFENLLSNAYKYTNQGGIEVTVSETQSEIEVSIKDTGAGIPSEELPFIFERFYRGEKSRNRKTGGAGIGLAVVKAIVEAHGGKIAVKSEMNQGSEFIVRFPKSFLHNSAL